jgi:formylglycine-generating enzyme required for sulfatase activity
VIYVDWNQASAYCAWNEKRMPTEAEWEKAARGPSAQAFPWGDGTPDCTLANSWQKGACVGDTSAVGSYPAGASPYGVMDMAGNVMEWVQDWYQPDYYSLSPYANPTGPSSRTHRVLRGRSWLNLWYYLCTAYRYYGYPNTPSNSIGFRCASSP